MKQQTQTNKTEWKEVELEDLIECVESGNRPKGGVGSLKEGIPSIGGEHINKFGGFDFSNIKFISNEFYSSQKRGIINLGNVLVVKDGATTGRVTIVLKENFPYKDALVNEHVFILRPKILIIEPKYLFYYLYSLYGQKQILDNFHGSAQGGINTQFVKNVIIPLPPLPVQKQIVSILEKAEKLKQKREEADKLTKEYLQSVFYEMFGDPVTNPKKWPIVKIREIINCAEYGTSKKSDEIENGITIIRMNNITYDGEWDFLDLKYIKFDEKETQKYLLNKGDLLFNRTNSKELVGKTAVYRSNRKMVYAGYLIRVKTNEKSSSEYISAYLNSDYGKRRLFNMCKSIVGMANINAQELQNIEIPLPPLPLQQKFASIVEKVEKLKEKQKQSKEEINIMFESLMQKAFNGSW